MLGPLVMAAVAIPEDRLEALAALGARDSKQLSAVRREQLFGPIHELAAVAVIEIAPAAIDGAPGQLDLLEVEYGAQLLEQLAPALAYVDAIGRGGATHRRRLSERLAGRALELVVENKADARYPVVGAASIVAKVIRDRRLAALEAEHGPLGSGYPSDPHTIAAVERLVRIALQRGEPLPPFVRARWATVRRVVARLSGAPTQRGPGPQPR